VVLQVICFVLVFFPGIVGGSDAEGATTTIQFRTGFLLVAIWWWGFGQFSLSRLPRSEPAGDPTKKHLLSNGYKELRKVWGQLTSLPVLKRISFFIFSFIIWGANYNVSCSIIWQRRIRHPEYQSYSSLFF
jgi:UMF1 family MFS transporter